MPDEKPRVYYRVRGWNELYENNQTRSQSKPSWLKVVIQVGSDEYVYLMAHPDGAAHFGAWNAIVQIAMQCNPRGSLLRFNGAPHTAESLAPLCAMNCTVVQLALNRLVEIGWLELASFTAHAFKDKKAYSTVQSTAHHAASQVQSSAHNGASPRARAKEEKREDTNTPRPPSTEGGQRKPTRRERQDAEIAAEIERSRKQV